MDTLGPSSESGRATSPPAESPALKGARELAGQFAGSGYSKDVVARWLLPRGFPARVQLDRPHEAIISALQALPMIGQPAGPVRRALAIALAELIQAEPEKDDGFGNRDLLLGELFALARAVHVPEILGDALRDAVLRGIPAGVRGRFGHPGPDLLSAAIDNQLDRQLGALWLSLLRFPEDDILGREARSAWHAGWHIGWEGICAMPAARRATFPALDAIIAAKSHLFRWITAEVTAAPAIDDPRVERRERYEALMDEVCARWPGVVDRARLTNLWFVVADKPCHWADTVFENASDERLAEADARSRLETILELSKDADFSSPRILERTHQEWMNPILYPRGCPTMSPPTDRGGALMWQLRYLRSGPTQLMKVTAFLRDFGRYVWI